MRDQVNLSAARSPAFTGRVVALLVCDPELANKSGKALRLAAEYGVVE